MDVSLVIATYRPGLHMPLSTLEANEFDGEWELILADERAKERGEELPKLLDIAPGIPHFKHINAGRPKHTCPASTFNQGIREASGELVLIGGDYAMYPKDYIQRHWDFYKEHGPDKTLTASYVDYGGDFPRDMSYAQMMENPIVHGEERVAHVTNWLDATRGLVRGDRVMGYIGIPRKLLRRLNGFDQIFDYGKGYSDCDLAMRAELMGHRFILDTRLQVNRVAHPHKDINDLRGVFKEKHLVRSREANRHILSMKQNLIERGYIPIDSHIGLENRLWNRHRCIVVQGGGAEICTLKWVKTLQDAGFPVMHNSPGVTFRMTDYVVYGVSLGDLQTILGNNLLGNGIKCWLWFTGSDAWNFCKGQPQIMLNHPNVRYLAVSERLQDELRDIGIDANVILDYEDDITREDSELLDSVPPNLQPLMINDRQHEGGFFVTIYRPDSNPEFYHWSLMKKVMAANPRIMFNIYGNQTAIEDLPKNAIDWGWVSGDVKTKLYRMTSVYLRSTVHDGIPYNMVEFIKMGRPVICNYEYDGTFLGRDEKEITGWIQSIKASWPENHIATWKKHYLDLYSEQMFIDGFKHRFFDTEVNR